MIFGRPDFGTREQWDKARGIPSFRLRISAGNGFVQSGRMPFAVAELGQQNLKERKIVSTIMFDPE